MRQSFFKFLNEETQPFFFLSADVGYPFDQKLKSMISDRFINMGVAEKNMVSFACGLAQSEKVFCYSIGPPTICTKKGRF